MAASYSTKVVLAMRSGNTCAFRDCNRKLTIDGENANPALLGQAAHIAGGKKGTARFDRQMSQQERDSYNNLIYLCGDCHTRIDAQEGDFPVEVLNDMKMAHEHDVKNAMSDAFAEIGFQELEKATEWIMKINPNAENQDFTVITPDEKIIKNELSDESRYIITMGLSVVKEIRSYLENIAQSDSKFPERLTAGFLEKYHSFRQHNYSGDELFNLMCQFSQQGFSSQAQRSAGLAILVYLFESCEVFEK